jgi:hypothetical protein
VAEAGHNIQRRPGISVTEMFLEIFERFANGRELVESEDALQDAERMFHFRSFSRPIGVLLFLELVQLVLELRALADHVLDLRSYFSIRFGLTFNVGPTCEQYFAFLAVGP